MRERDKTSKNVSGEEGEMIKRTQKKIESKEKREERGGEREGRNGTKRGRGKE